MRIDYDHSKNYHFTSGPRVAFPLIFGERLPKSLLDVGCGIGTWLRTALDAGVPEVFGVDGVAVAPQNFLVAKTLFRQQDLTQQWSLGRQFEAAICLEVAEHLEEKHAGTLVGAITDHSPLVIFGAACPGQTGQHHVNCQWPEYWQKLFNDRGYTCFDEVRWLIWRNQNIEPWYRQNIFVARKDPKNAGTEPRIPSVIHPDIYQLMTESNFRSNAELIGAGSLPFKWYLNSFPKVLLNKIKGRLK